MTRALLVTAVVATMTALTGPAVAGVSFNTIHREAIVDDAGRVVSVSGPIRCSEVQRAAIRITVSQRTTGAVGEGRWRGLCRRTTSTWTTRRLVLQGSATFEPGRAQACALGLTRRAGKVTDAKQWCQTVRLVQRRQERPRPAR